MINYYKTIDGVVTPIDEAAHDCWVNVINPTEDELQFLINEMKIDSDFARAALDEEETSRIENEDEQSFIIVDVPYAQKENNLVTYTTIPLGIITTSDYIITVCLKETSVIKDFSDGKIKNVYTHMKTRFVLQLLYKVATRFLQYLRQIDKMSNYIEKQLHISMKNKELIQLLDLEKSLVFFSTSLKANEITIEKVLRGRFIRLYEDDQELLEDVLIEIKQAIEMSNIYSSILSGTMDAFASVISNNLNIVMKMLTFITILMTLPTMISSFFGMNVSGIPFANFWLVVIFSVLVTTLVGFFLYKKKLY